MPEISKSDYEFLQKKRTQESKQRRYDTEVRIKNELFVRKAKDAEIPEPTDAEVDAEIDLRIKNGTMKPF